MLPGIITKNKNNFGFTIIEVMIALAILSVALVYLISFFPTGLNSVMSSKNTSVATFLAQAKIEETISQEYENLVSGTINESSLADIHADFSKFSRTTTINLVDGDLNLSVNDLGIKKIAVAVFWTDPLLGSMASTSLNTIVIK